MSELLRRLITAIVVIPLIVAATLTLNSAIFAAIIGLLVLAGAWEWAGLAGWRSTVGRAGFSALTLFIIAGCYLIMQQAPRSVPALLVLGMLWWAVALVWTLGYQRRGDVPVFDPPLVRALTGLLILVPAWSAVVWLHAAEGAGPGAVLLLLVLIWVADIGAYFSGRRWGIRRLAPRVSPGKTWEGVAGGLLAAVLVAFGYALLNDLDKGQAALMACLAAVTALVSVLGDLTESMFKRRAGMKDSGKLFPGHGGALDRIDSITAAAPFFCAGWIWGGFD